MSNYPAPREIPAGKVLITPFGYSPPQSEFAKVEKIAEIYCPHVAVRARVRLEWSSPGWECAGAAMRWTNGYWAVRWQDRNGCTQGQRFLNTDEGEAQARARFDHYSNLKG